MILFILAGLSLAIWIVLVFFRGQFWRADQCLAAISTPLTNPPSVVAIIPARNEELTIGRTNTSTIFTPGLGSLFTSARRIALYCHDVRLSQTVLDQ